MLYPAALLLAIDVSSCGVLFLVDLFLFTGVQLAAIRLAVRGQVFQMGEAAGYF